MKNKEKTTKKMMLETKEMEKVVSKRERTKKMIMETKELQKEVRKRGVERMKMLEVITKTTTGGKVDKICLLILK